VKAEATETKPNDEGSVVGGEMLSGRGSAAMSERPKQKRPAVDKQVAYLEFKSTTGKKIEENIIVSRQEMKQKRAQTNELTIKINLIKNQIDKIKLQIDKKEDERKLQTRMQKNDMAMDPFGDDDDDANQEEIIDEEELILLKDMKDFKRDYRENFNTL
jgi:hypothetical protein